MEPAKVFLRGNFGEGNFGDDALLIANLLLLRESGHELVLEGEEAAYRDPRFPIRCLDPECVRGPGTVLYGGGTQFFSMAPIVAPDAPIQSLAAQAARLASEPSRIVRSIRTRLRNRRIAALPHAAIGLGIGPFAPDDSDEERVVALLRRMTLLWVRDRELLEFCRRYGLGLAIQSSDLCFTHGFRVFIAAHEGAGARPGGTHRIGIVLRNHPRLGPAFHEKMVSVIQAIRQKAIDVDVISFSQAHDDFQPFYASRNVPVVQWNASNDTVDAFTRRLGGYSMLLTARFHGGVFGILTGRPFVAIAIEPKLETLQEIYRPGSQVMISPEAPPADYVEVVEDTLGALDRLETETRLSLATQAKTAEIGERELARFLGERD